MSTLISYESLNAVMDAMNFSQVLIICVLKLITSLSELRDHLLRVGENGLFDEDFDNGLAKIHTMQRRRDITQNFRISSEREMEELFSRWTGEKFPYSDGTIFKGFLCCAMTSGSNACRQR